jgi:hypothetical protein
MYLDADGWTEPKAMGHCRCQAPGCVIAHAVAVGLTLQLLLCKWMQMAGQSPRRWVAADGNPAFRGDRGGHQLEADHCYRCGQGMNSQRVF